MHCHRPAGSEEHVLASKVGIGLHGISAEFLFERHSLTTLMQVEPVLDIPLNAQSLLTQIGLQLVLAERTCCLHVLPSDAVNLSGLEAAPACSYALLHI
jgi:hypothetical protein